jgi:hypothetical protein
VEQPRTIQLGNRRFRVRLNKGASFRLASCSRTFQDSDDTAQLILLIWALIDGKMRPDPGEIAELLPDDEDEMAEIIRVVVAEAGGADEDTVEEKEAKKKPRNGRSSARKSA